MASLVHLPTELRHEIISLAIWTPEPRPHPASSQERHRVRPKSDWDIWVLEDQPVPTAISLILTCKSLHADVLSLVSSHRGQEAPYELDIMFVPGCGLFPTWLCCPLPSQKHLHTVRASFRIFNADETDHTMIEWFKIPDHKDSDYLGAFAGYFVGLSSCFNTQKTYPNPPPGAHNFYRLLASFFALGPAGMLSPTIQDRNTGVNALSTCRYTIKHLIIDVVSKPKAKTMTSRTTNRLVALFLGEVPEDDGNEPNQLPYEDPDHPVTNGPSGEENACYMWNGPTRLWNASGAAEGCADRLGFYLANMLWALLDFKWLSRGFGLIVYEGILDTVEFCVDGEARPCYDLDHLIQRVPGSEHCAPETMKALMRWKAWAAEWRGHSRDGVAFTEPRPAFPFVRYPGRWEWLTEQMFPESYMDVYR